MPSAVFAKLQLKDQPEIVVINAPASFEGEIRKCGAKVRRELQGPLAFGLAFVTKQGEVDKLGKAMTKAADGDAVVWFAYPKASSKRYTSEINRDNGWQVMGDAGFEPVRAVAIDEDWSAVRFRRVGFIKVMKRHVSGAMTKEGKARTTTKR